MLAASRARGRVHEVARAMTPRPASGRVDTVPLGRQQATPNTPKRPRHDGAAVARAAQSASADSGAASLRGEEEEGFFRRSMETLAEMGFTDRDTARAALQACGCDLQRAVLHLLR